MSVVPISGNRPNHEPSTETNPLLPGIDLCSDSKEMLKRIARNPFRNSSWLQANRDLDLLPLYCKQVVAPTSQGIRIGLAIHRVLRISLAQQNPHMQSMRVHYFCMADNGSDGAYLTGVHQAMSVTGITATAKTFLVKAALATVPRLLIKEKIGDLERVAQIVWLYIDMSSVSSIEAFAERLIDEIDATIGARGELRDRVLRGVRGAHAKMSVAVRLLRTHFVGLLVLDEIQPENFGCADAAPLRSWMLRIANCGIGLVLVGNPLGFDLKVPKVSKTDEVLSTQVMRRLLSSERIRLDPAPSHKDRDWKVFTHVIDRCRLFELPPLQTNEHLAELKHRLVGGIPDFYVDLHIEIERILSRNTNRPIDADLVKEAAHRSTKIQAMQPLIEGFAKRDLTLLRTCHDVDHHHYRSLWNISAGESSPTTVSGPVGLIAVPPSGADPVKHQVNMKKAADRSTKRKKAKKERELSPVARAVAQTLRNDLAKLINGSPPGDRD